MNNQIKLFENVIKINKRPMANIRRLIELLDEDKYLCKHVLF